MQAVANKSRSRDVESADVFEYKLRSKPATQEEVYVDDNGGLLDENVMVNNSKNV